jgi:hypothetical protein
MASCLRHILRWFYTKSRDLGPLQDSKTWAALSLPVPAESAQASVLFPVPPESTQASVSFPVPPEICTLIVSYLPP